MLQFYEASDSVQIKLSNEAYLTFVDLREYVEERMGTETWITLYEIDDSPGVKNARFCALVSPDHLSVSLAELDWDLRIGSTGVTFVEYGDDTYRYLRLGDEPVEPFVYCREFAGMHNSYFEISEEFRHFHNLYEDKKAGNLIAIDEAGDDIPVVRIDGKRVQARLSYVKEYLTARDMCMLLFFEFDRYSPRSLAEIGIERIEQSARADDCIYRYFVDSCEDWMSNSYKSFGRLRGKKVIRGTPKRRRATPWTTNRKYEDFIIGLDEDGDEVLFTCNEDKLANFFGKNPSAPQFLTPVFFKRDVLGKYYGDARRYSVEDSHITCGGLWSVRIDNNHAQYVTVFLGDLGHMPHKEQMYWRSFNIPPDGQMSDTYFGRSILGQWLNPEASDLLFKLRYERFRTRWSEAFDWNLYKPLKAADAHYLGTLHIPSDGNQADFDNQTMALAKVLIERLNEAELAQRTEVADGDKGIAKFEKFLATEGFHPAGMRLEFLRNLQALRSGPAHVKGATYEKAARHFRVEEDGHQAAFDSMLRSAIDLLDALSDRFLPAEPADALLDAMDALAGDESEESGA
ncbi:hypothetical protein KIF24_05410 [Micromonospora sp. Llam7]|uniref:hypothetical protein n=1 Tax=Micromonospora tarapacensis TaxID=2835305 RepID=UPI001C82C764|nr:hypothetical protein [Micromonospora tarapacensis]MBX7265535.1 hypothetical protein [Micromonospora tarapacensis]